MWYLLVYINLGLKTALIAKQVYFFIPLFFVSLTSLLFRIARPLSKQSLSLFGISNRNRSKRSFDSPHLREDILVKFRFPSANPICLSGKDWLKGNEVPLVSSFFWLKWNRSGVRAPNRQPPPPWRYTPPSLTYFILTHSLSLFLRLSLHASTALIAVLCRYTSFFSAYFLLSLYCFEARPCTPSCSPSPLPGRLTSRH